MLSSSYNQTYGAELSTLGPPILPSVQIVGPNGKPFAPPVPIERSETDRTDPQMLAYDSYLLQIMQLGRYNPDVFVLHKGYEELDGMLNFSAYEFALRMLKYATLYKPPTLLPAVQSKDEEKKSGFRPGDYEKSQEIVDYWNYVLDDIRDPATDFSMGLRDVLWYMLDAVHLGFSVLEKIWKVFDSGPYKGKWGLSQIVSRHPKQIGFQLDPYTLQPVNVTSTTPMGGRQALPISVRDVILYTFNPYRNLPHGRGLARICFKNTWSMEQAIRWWGIAVKRHGSPFLEGRVTNRARMGRFLNMLMAVEEGAPLVYASDQDGAEIKVHYPPGGTLDGFEKFLTWNERQIMQTFFGSNLTSGTGDGAGSYALGAVHERSRDFMFSGPRNDIQGQFTRQVLRQGTVFSFGEESRHLAPRLFLGHWNDAERLALAKLINDFIDHDVIMPNEEWIRKEVGFVPMTTLASQNPALLPGRERVNVDLPQAA